MSARGAAAPRPAPAHAPRPRSRPRAVTATRRRRRTRLRLGLAVIPLVALLFGGVVYLNAAKLSVTKRQGQVARQMTAVQEQLVQLKAAQARADTDTIATAEKLGMIKPSSGDWTYVRARTGP